MQIQLVIFDLGRVLIRIHDDWATAGRAVGVEVTPEQAARLAAAGDELTQTGHDHECGRIDDQAFAAAVSRLSGMHEADVLAGLDAWIIEPYDGAGELLAQVKASGRKVACLSNTNAWHWRCMSDPSHRKYVGTCEMDWAFASQELGCRKPEPAIYEQVERITRIAPQCILFFDDLQANLDAARRRGWNTFLIRRDMDPIAQMRGYLRAVSVLGWLA